MKTEAALGPLCYLTQVGAGVPSSVFPVRGGGGVEEGRGCRGVVRLFFRETKAFALLSF